MAHFGDHFHPSFEPVVIINSLDDEEENINIQDSKSNLQSKLSNNFEQKDKIQRNVQPDITIFPVRKASKANFKESYFYKGSSSDESKDYYNDEVKLKRSFKSPGIRTPIRLVSKDEILHTGDIYTRRKSSPLEKCPICKKYFRRMKTHLLKHEMQEGLETTAFICEICSKAFYNHSNLQVHMRTHTGQKPYICDICTKSFTQSCNLVNHMRVHTGEKPFKCPHCDRAFTQSGNLNNHIRLHTAEKPFKCHFCDKAFVQSGNLNSHIRNNHRLKDFSKMAEPMMT
ncbi:uncharacterized protein LOC143195748 isoform X3 [Rhynchophorus ferrugineus]|uniref:uncharacterized protein LOC143195748 isoform X3 n=1 Tax=Rhynchophorus ferrugineus TaxID=354439 RepID=UPI003FCD0489